MPTDPRLKRGAMVHCLSSRVLRHGQAKNIFGTNYTTTFLDGRVLEVQTKRITDRTYKYLRCVFALSSGTKEATLPLNAAKHGLRMPMELQPEYPDDDPMFRVNAIFSPPPESGILNPDPSPVLDIPDGTPDTSDILEGSRDPNSGHHTAIQSVNANDSIGSLGIGSSIAHGGGDSMNAINAHGQVWRKLSRSGALNGPTPKLNCRVRCADGTVVQAGTAGNMFTPLDAFMTMMPLSYMPTIFELTNKKLFLRPAAATTSGELFKFFGLIILMTRVKFSNRRELWRRTSDSEYLPLHNFGKIMPRQRFEVLRNCIRFSLQEDDPLSGNNANERH